MRNRGEKGLRVVFAMRSKNPGAVDRTVSQVRLDGEWLPLVPGSFYTDGEGGFACTTSDAALGGRTELTGPLWAIEGLDREVVSGRKPTVNSPDAKRLTSRRRHRPGSRRRLLASRPHDETRTARPT